MGRVGGVEAEMRLKREGQGIPRAQGLFSVNPSAGRWETPPHTSNLGPSLCPSGSAHT